MANYKFKPSERFAVYTVHGETCYLCRQPIDMSTFQVDHIIPETLAYNSEAFDKTCNSYGLPSDFDVNSFENWMPACAACNNRKRDAVFEALPILAVELQKAQDKADRAREIESDIRTNRQVSRAITTIERAQQEGTLGDVHFDRLRPLLEYQEEHREPDKKHAPLLIGPGIEILSQDRDFVTVKGPYGIGRGRLNPPDYGGFRCPSCGHSAWNGARCVICGTQDDD